MFRWLDKNTIFFDEAGNSWSGGVTGAIQQQLEAGKAMLKAAGEETVGALEVRAASMTSSGVATGELVAGQVASTKEGAVLAVKDVSENAAATVAGVTGVAVSAAADTAAALKDGAKGKLTAVTGKKGGKKKSGKKKKKHT